MPLPVFVYCKKRDCTEFLSGPPPPVDNDGTFAGYTPILARTLTWQERFSPRAEDVVRRGAVSHQVPHGRSEWQGMSPVPTPLLGNGVWIGLRVLRAAFFW